MRERSFRPCDDERAPEPEAVELAAFFRELGLGWEYDAECLLDRLAGSGGEG